MKAFLIVGLLALAGCGPSRSELVRAQVDADIAQCGADRSSGKLKSQTELAHCLNSAEAPNLAQVGSHSDLLNLKFANRVALAEKVDKNLLTPAEADLEAARMRSGIMSEVKQRLSAEAASRPVTCNRYGGSVTCY